MFLSILKFNPFHDANGRFSTADSANFASITNPKALKDIRSAHWTDKVKSSAYEMGVMAGHQTLGSNWDTYRDHYRTIEHSKNFVEGSEQIYDEHFMCGVVEGKKRFEADKKARAAALASQPKRQAPKALDAESVHDALNDLGVKLPAEDDKKAAVLKTWAKHMPNIHPKEFFEAFVGKDHATPENLSNFKLKIDSDGALNVTSYNAVVHGAGSSHYERTINFKDKDVSHDYLRLYEDQQGSGAVKKAFKACLPLYKKMGMNTVSLAAGLDKGAYAWSRYGFEYATEADANSHADVLGRRLTSHESKIDNMPALPQDKAVARDEVAAMRSILTSAKNGNRQANWLLTDMKTPGLNAVFNQSLGLVYENKGTFAKYLFEESGYSGKLHLDGADEGASLDRITKYIGKAR